MEDFKIYIFVIQKSFLCSLGEISLVYNLRMENKCFFFTQQHSWAQDRIEFFLNVPRDINAIAFNSSGAFPVYMDFGILPLVM